MKKLIVFPAAAAFLAAGGSFVAATENEPDPIPGRVLEVHQVQDRGRTQIGRLVSGETASVVVDSGKKCLVLSTGHGTCRPVDVAVNGSANTNICSPVSADRIRIMGLVPPNTSAVEVSYENGDRFAATLLGIDGYVVDPPAPRVVGSLPSEVLFSTSAGETSLPVPVSRDFLVGACAEGSEQ